MFLLLGCSIFGGHVPTPNYARDSRPPFIDCEHSVPRTSTSMPIRSPQVAHSILAWQAMGRRVVEIGSSAGDVTMCLAATASHVDAIEIDNATCQKLVWRRDMAGASFNMHCRNFSQVPVNVWAQADYITWWIGGLRENLQVLGWLHSIREQLHHRVQVVMVHGSAQKYDMVSFEHFRPLMSWVNSTDIPYSEKQQCCEHMRASGIVSTSHWTCARASGQMHVGGVLLMHDDLKATLDSGWKLQQLWNQAAIRKKGGYPGNWRADQLCRKQ